MFDRRSRQSGGHSTKFAQAWRRLLSSNAELESEDLQEASRSMGAVPIKSCEDRDKVTLSGTVSSMVVDSDTDAPGLEVEVRDGSGAVTLIWLGRSHIAGIEAGATIRVTGRVSCRGAHRVMYNPAYELITASSH